MRINCSVVKIPRRILPREVQVVTERAGLLWATLNIPLSFYSATLSLQLRSMAATACQLTKTSTRVRGGGKGKQYTDNIKQWTKMTTSQCVRAAEDRSRWRELVSQAMVANDQSWSAEKMTTICLHADKLYVGELGWWYSMYPQWQSSTFISSFGYTFAMGIDSYTHGLRLYTLVLL